MVISASTKKLNFGQGTLQFFNIVPTVFKAVMRKNNIVFSMSTL